LSFTRRCGLFQSLFEELFVSDVFAYFDVVLKTVESNDAIKQWIFRIVEVLFEPEPAYCYANFYTFSASNDLIEALLVASIFFHDFPIFNQLNQNDSPLNYANSKG
jgi:hypothetical protein